jgi:Fe-S cluster assembly iron-binding protein IscA
LERSANEPSLFGELPDGQAIRVTTTAIAQIKYVGGYMHCFVAAAGCAGVGLFFSTRLNIGERTYVTVSGANIEITLDTFLAAHAAGATLDYGAQLKPPRFRWIRLNVPGRCSCRRSFGELISAQPLPQCMSAVPQCYE